MTQHDRDLDPRLAVDEALWAAEASVSRQLGRVECSHDARASLQRETELLDALLAEVRARLQARNEYVRSHRG